MTHRRFALVAAGLIFLGVLALVVALSLERLFRSTGEPPQAASPGSPATAAVPHITATLFYGTADGQALVAVRRDVPLAEGVIALGRQILTAQLQPAPAPYVSVMPEGTMLRAFYVTERGDAFVDLSSAISTAHPGGSFSELLTIYAIVNAVTANLPSVQRVQILIDGKEAETLAGHIDLRRPLQRDLSIVREPDPDPSTVSDRAKSGLE